MRHWNSGPIEDQRYVMLQLLSHLYGFVCGQIDGRSRPDLYGDIGMDHFGSPTPLLGLSDVALRFLPELAPEVK
jgi:hypothetical protein